MMFIAIVGTRFSGRSTIRDYLVTLKGFTLLRLVETELPTESDDVEQDSQVILVEQGSPYSHSNHDGDSLEEFPTEGHLRARHISFLSLGSPHLPSYRVNADFSWGKRHQNQLSFSTPSQMLDHVTRNWRARFVTTDLVSRELVELFIKRPFFMLVSVDAPILERFQRSKRFGLHALDAFVQQHDSIMYGTGSHLSDSLTFGSKQASSLHSLNDLVDLHIVNSFDSVPSLHEHLDTLGLLNPERLRPGWDTYFMTLAQLASRRSNCMKRRVGAILVRQNRIVSTGYNGTPRGLPNCNDGGCIQCNSGGSSECVCLHAEENALLEAGRERIGDAVLYCNTCPCLKCTIKIIQTGIKEVVYNLSYKVDDASAELFRQAGVNLRRHDPNLPLGLPASTLGHTPTPG